MSDSQEVRELKAQLAAAQAKLEAQEELRRRGLFFKISPKGAISVFGLARRPITLYANQWRTILDVLAAPLDSFIQDNQQNLATK